MAKASLFAAAFSAGLLAAGIPAAALAQSLVSEPRLALVIGNGAYRDQPLANPVNDAKAMAASLRKLGFAVIERIDAGKSAMESAVLEFGDKLRGGGVGLFYYAGHGIQSGGRNYLLPVDVRLTTEASVRVYGVDANLVTDLMSDARNRANVVILDACRNNPFVMAMRGASKGLAAIDAARGTLIAYSTAPGQIAADGEGLNSPYTAGLLKALDQPGLKAEEVFKRARVHVADATKGAQTPWESSSLTGDLILNLSITIQAPPQAQAPAPPAAAPGNRDAVEAAFWNSIAASNDPQDFTDYLKQFPSGTFSGLAQRRLAELKRQQQAAEIERKRKEAEAEKQRVAALEAERQRKEAEAEKQRLAALEAESRQREEAARQRRASMTREEIAKSVYERVINKLFAQKFSATSSARVVGKPISIYRTEEQNKAIAACLDWSGNDVDAVVSRADWIGSDYSFLTAARKYTLENCAKYEFRGCKCQIVDENDKNVLQVPDEFYRRVTAKQ
ncbi:MAG: caspase family protein [Rhodospirillales bacterium]